MIRKRSRRIQLPRVWLCLCLLTQVAVPLFSAAPAKNPHAQMMVYGDWSSLNHTYGSTDIFAGVVPLRATVTNQANTNRTFLVRFSMNNTYSSITVDNILPLPAGNQADITLPVIIDPHGEPPYSSIRGNLTLYENGDAILSEQVRLIKPISDPLLPVLLISGEGGNNARFDVPLEDATPKPEQEDASSNRRQRSRRPNARKQPPTELSISLQRIKPDAIPPHFWPCYINHKAILIEAGAIHQLGPKQKEAIWKYAAWGGTVILLNIPLDQLLPATMAKNTMAKARTTPYGEAALFLAGEICHSPNDTLSNAAWQALARSRLKGKSYYEALLDDSDELGNLENQQRRFRHRRNPFDQKRRASPLTASFDQTPLGLFILILVCFTVAAGPLNYLLIRKLKQPLLLLVTSPVISITFIVFLFTAIFLAHGVGLKQTLASFTLLDQSLNLQATTVKSGMFSSFPPNHLAMPADRFFMPLGEAHNLQVKYAEDQKVQGFLPARIARSFLAAEVKATRKTLTIMEADGALWAVNGLGTSIEKLVVRRQGKLYIAQAIPEGGRARLTWHKKYSANSFRSKFFMNELLTNPAADSFDPQDKLWDASPAGSYRFQPGEQDFFMARTDTSPFWTGQKDVESTVQFHIIYGPMAHAP